MGATRTPAHVVEFAVIGGGHTYTPAIWRRTYGRPTPHNLAVHVKAFEASTLPGGANAHLGATRVSMARIVANRGERRLLAGYLREQTVLAMGALLRGVEIPEGVLVYTNSTGAVDAVELVPVPGYSV